MSWPGVIIACDAEDIRYSDILLPDPDAPESPHQDCAHVEFDLLDNCRMCGRERAACE
jgi:hypothetical protein